MHTFTKLSLIKWSNAVTTGYCFLALASAILISPAITPLQNVQAAIDEVMPATIPDSIVADWKDQDGTDFAAAISKIKTAYPSIAGKITGTDEQGYLSACHWRRVARLKNYPEIENIMFARHHNFGGIIVGYHDNSDVSNTDDAWKSSGALCILNFNNYYPISKDLLTKTDAVVRDPCISFDGKKVLFAISGKGKGTGYKIYEMEIADPATLKQLTDDDGLGTVVADFEPCYLPNGTILFTSTRNFGLVDCAFNPTTNMFLMNGDGTRMHQVGFDQASTFYPVLLDGGTVLYTRWEYNDRDITNSMGLFTMYPDGSHQTEFFGNQTPWPFTMIQGRPIPGTQGTKVMCIAGGHHGPYSGELMIVDRFKGTDGTDCIQMIAPKRATKPDANKSDKAQGNVNFLFQTPLPLDENNFLVSWRASESESNYKLYFMNVDGSRELLAWADQSVSQPVLIQSREMPKMPALQANYNDSEGVFTIYDVYYGKGMEGIKKESGIAKRLRVIKLNYRVAGLQSNFGQTMPSGPTGIFTPAITCPISAYGASWEAKEVLGEAKIYPSGYASFRVPARTPVYFQVIDSNGYCVASMRSWSTLMPGEHFSCIGCHENKVEAPPSGISWPQADPQKLDTPLGIENQPFDYTKMVQPILDAKCVSCHTEDHESGFDLSGTVVTKYKRSWATSYNSLLQGIGPKSSNDAINICTIFSPPEQQLPYSFGSSLSGIMTKALNGTNADMNKLLTQTEKDIIACWIDLAAPYAGTYNSHMSTSDSTAYEKLLDKRRKWAAIEKEHMLERCWCPVIGTMPDDHKNVKPSCVTTEQLLIGYVPKRHALVLKNSFPGNLFLTDLGGRVVYHMKLSEQHANSTATISLPSSLGTGMYIAKFESVNGVRQTTISITQ